jgi:hypothetical protein
MDLLESATNGSNNISGTISISGSGGSVSFGNGSFYPYGSTISVGEAVLHKASSEVVITMREGEFRLTRVDELFSRKENSIKLLEVDMPCAGELHRIRISRAEGEGIKFELLDHHTATLEDKSVFKALESLPFPEAPTCIKLYRGFRKAILRYEDFNKVLIIFGSESLGGLPRRIETMIDPSSLHVTCTSVFSD